MLDAILVDDEVVLHYRRPHTVSRYEGFRARDHIFFEDFIFSGTFETDERGLPQTPVAVAEIRPILV